MKNPPLCDPARILSAARPLRASPRAAVALALASTLCAASATSLENGAVVDGIAAQVGSEVVLISEVMRTAEPIEKRLREAGAPAAQVMSIRGEALERLIEAKIVASVVQRTELGASDEELDNAIRMIAGDAGLTVEQLIQSVASHGMTLSEYRGQIKQEIERSKVVNAMVRSRIRVEQDEIYNLYMERYGEQPQEGGVQIRLRHILVSAGASTLRTHDSACAELETVRSRIIAGETNFDQAARSVSDFKAEVGGDLGWMHARELAAWMVPTVNALEPGQMTPVLPMNFGCNLLMLVDRRDYKATSFKEIERALEAELRERKTGEEYAEWVEKLRAQTYIERKGDFAELSRGQGGPGGPGRHR